MKNYLRVTVLTIARLTMGSFAMASFAMALFGNTAHAADVGVSVTVGHPGFYGRIDISDYPYPQPRVIYHQPRMIERVYIEREPIYLRVPPGHARNWRKHCYKYHACDERVYFVQDNWYHREYVPHYREYHREYHHDHRNRWDDHDDYRDNDWDDHRDKKRKKHKKY
jgi:hypothetical protein